ncbi:hypothetical protein ILYODFUR_031544, partial [Ilyodon furcidens]
LLLQATHLGAISSSATAFKERPDHHSPPDGPCSWLTSLLLSWISLAHCLLSELTKSTVVIRSSFVLAYLLLPTL